MITEKYVKTGAIHAIFAAKWVKKQKIIKSHLFGSSISVKSRKKSTLPLFTLRVCRQSAANSCRRPAFRCRRRTSIRQRLPAESNIQQKISVPSACSSRKRTLYAFHTVYVYESYVYAV